MKIRAATLFDLLRIAAARRRLRVFRLNAPYTLVQPEALLGDALTSRLPVNPQGSFIYVCDEGTSILGFVQGRCRWRRRDEWSITALGTTEKDPAPVWNALLEVVCRAAGEEGVIRLFAKIPQDDPMAELFRGLGFTNYANERV